MEWKCHRNSESYLVCLLSILIALSRRSQIEHSCYDSDSTSCSGGLPGIYGYIEVHKDYRQFVLCDSI